jgi:hypothetical protein
MKREERKNKEEKDRRGRMEEGKGGRGRKPPSSYLLGSPSGL